MKRSELTNLIREVIQETIRKVGSKYVVYPEKGGKRLGTHSTRAAAEKQLTAVHLNKESVSIQYKNPNFEEEWMEAIRYPEFEEMGKEGWIQTAKRGKPHQYSQIKNVLGNVDLDFESLEEPKKERFLKAFQRGVLEMPIAVKFSDQDYDLVAGNTRLAGLVKNGIDPQIWIVDLSNLSENIHDPVRPGILKNQIKGKVTCSKAKALKAKQKDKSNNTAKAAQRFLNYHDC